ncbi:MAG: EFR1 family ferrodoxin [Defluviitaleaceae bacterium]|nr:EFR1 family ferrodoxin [Defluviitaleaceae bacterium]
MKKVCLCYFSGTGMTKYVVNRLVSEIEKHNVSVDIFKIEETDGQGIDMTQYDGLIMAYPTHSLNAPKIVINFAKRLPKASGVNTFVINTCSVESNSTHGSSQLLNKKLNKRGYKVLYNKLVEMPSNFASKDTEKQVITTLAKADALAVVMAKDIINLEHHFVERSFGAKTLTALARIEWLGAPIIGKFIYTKASCTRCKKCVNNCPNKNIILNKKSIKFKLSCGLCMRCVYKCPENAIYIRKPFKFIRFDKWYDNDAI